MSSLVCVAGATFTCPHVGILTLSGETIALVDSKGIATDNSTSTDSTLGCTWINPVTLVASPCLTIKSISGFSTVFTVLTNSVILASSSIVLNNADTASFPSGVSATFASAAQSKLLA